MTDAVWMTSLAMLGAAAAAVGAYELLFVLPLRRRIAHLEAQIHALGRSIGGQSGLASQLARSERTLLDQVRHLAERLGQFELSSASRPYERAIDLAARGGPAERLVARFGLSEGEASLVRLLHGKDPRPKSPGRTP